jgi:hypothetical protein
VSIVVTVSLQGQGFLISINEGEAGSSFYDRNLIMFEMIFKMDVFVA